MWSNNCTLGKDCKEKLFYQAVHPYMYRAVLCAWSSNNSLITCGQSESVLTQLSPIWNNFFLADFIQVLIQVWKYTRNYIYFLFISSFFTRPFAAYLCLADLDRGFFASKKDRKKKKKKLPVKHAFSIFLFESLPSLGLETKQNWNIPIFRIWKATWDNPDKTAFYTRIVFIPDSWT